MNTEERLKEAEKLLFEMRKYTDSRDTLKRIEKFLNPEPEIDWKRVPAGTLITHLESNEHCCFDYYCGSEVLSTMERNKEPVSKFIIPPQPSHIHKIPWPEDGSRPEWVTDDDLVITSDSTKRLLILKAHVIAWHNSPSTWYAVLKLTEYRKGL